MTEEEHSQFWIFRPWHQPHFALSDFRESTGCPVCFGVPLLTQNEGGIDYPQPVDKLGLFCQLFFSAEPVSYSTELLFS